MTLTFLDGSMVALLVQLAGWAIVFGGLIYIPFRRSPSAAQAWLLLFFFLPWVAILVYYVFGHARHPKWRNDRLAAVPTMVERALGDLKGEHLRGADRLGPRHRITADLVERIGGLPCVRGNAIDLDADYNRVVDRIAADIDRARNHAHLSFYILQADEAGNKVLSALERAAARGVKCRLLIDAVGSSADSKKIVKRLAGTGVEVSLILPLRFWNQATRFDLRNHRKIVVIDGRIGWCGSQNMHRIEYEPKTFYRELMVRVTGPAVLELQAVFIGDWFLETNEDIGTADLMPPPAEADLETGALLQVMPTGPDYPNARVDILFTDLIHTARRRVVLATPYFIPNEPLLQALSTAVAKGVDTVLFVTGTTNSLLIDLAQESYYEDLLEAGVRVFLYRERFLHAKHLSIDDGIAVFGSANMDRRSFELNSEVSLIAYDRGSVESLRRVEADYFAKSRALDLETWQRRSFARKVAENATRLVSPLL
ncbi:cardiolipin synthase [Aurantimonas sp. Leaf443]|uniref:cardiolipin synthase n=1 Tax=Aurantimonas sp. Leaf443 TaxID=1736378 RepID=UPI001FCD45C5|nr:cardiolipin synthase [Aurantimonas sp. Leaf443]